MTAPTISLSGLGLSITFPSDHTGRTHTVEVPMNLGGLKIIRKALMARQQESDRRIGNHSSPTQQMVNEWLEADRRELAKKPLIADLDLSSIDLDL